MRKVRSVFTALVIIFIGIVFSGCQQNYEETFSVWTDSITYKEFENSFGSGILDDGYYVYLEIAETQWESFSADIDEEPHNWTFDKIKTWFLGRGFDDGTATKATSWITTVDHGFLATRTGSVVYLMIK